ncbi:MAG: terminase gpA endonuclease subunit [Planctomycetaceae bacterium]
MSVGALNAGIYRRNALRYVPEVLRFARPRRIRSIVDFAEAELRYPTGRYRGEKFSRRFQPATTLLLEELSSDYWRESWIIGPHQAGKSFSIVAWMFHCLFERQEDVIFGLPDLAMRSVKWRKDILPMLEASSFRGLLPSSGSGSKGGIGEIVTFRNGVSLQFMGAGGGDTQRAGSTARNLIVTEAEAFGARGTNSEESSKWEQIRGRVAHFAGSERVLAECTVTVEESLMWSNYIGGTASSVVMPCHGCGNHVAPEREHLVGWQDAKTEEQARANGRFSCPRCGIVWNESERLRNLQSARLIHAGQTIDLDNNTQGDIPPTRKLGFRFSAASNAFSDAGSIAVEEWSRERLENPEARANKDRAISQFRFAVPVKQQTLEIAPLEVRALLTRCSNPSIGFAPRDTIKVYAGVDVRKTQVHWALLAFRDALGPRFVSWGVESVNNQLTTEEGLTETLEALQKRFGDGVPVDASDKILPVSFALCDAGWQTQMIQKACERDPFWMPCKGFGAGILRDQSYRTPRATGSHCRLIGDGFHIAHVADRWLVELDANRWKSRLLQSMRARIEGRNGLTFANAEERSLRAFLAQLTSEPEIERSVGGELVTTFGEPRGANHWLDAAYLAMAARSVDDALSRLLASTPPEQPEVIEWQLPGSSVGGLF